MLKPVAPAFEKSRIVISKVLLGFERIEYLITFIKHDQQNPVLKKVAISDIIVPPVSERFTLES